MYDNNFESNSDKQIVQLIGNYIKHHRQNQNMTQADLAEHAGINRSTLSEIENGRRSNTITLIRILRSLKKLDILEPFSMTYTFSPMALAEEQAKYKSRKRVRNKKKDSPSLPKSDW